MNTYIISDLKEIRRTAADFIRNMDDATVFAFYGKMGVGKTTFIRAICEELGVEDAVNSPTFSIVNEYRSVATGALMYHFDFYRIQQLQEALEIGVEDYFDSGAFCFIEWPEHIDAILPDNTVHITLTEEQNGARIIRKLP